MKITAETTLKEIMEMEGGEPILKKHGVPCVTCPMAAFEINKLQIGEVARVYDLDLGAILKDLNA